MKHGGFRPGSGRPKGSINRLTAAMVDAANDGLHPFGYLLSIVRDEAQPVEMRIQAARAALPFCAHKLASMELTVEQYDSRRVEEMTDAELYALIQQDRDDSTVRKPVDCSPATSVDETST